MEFDQKLIQHFTAAELVEFLDLDVSVLLDRLEPEIEHHFDELCEEIGYEYDPDDIE